MTETGGAGRTAVGGEAGAAVVLAALWAAALVLLAGLWVRSPFTGPGSMFLVWSVAAAPLLAWSWSRFRRWHVSQLPTRAIHLAGIAVVWAAVAALAGSGIGAEMALDGLVMREGLLRAFGRLLQWTPGVFGLLLSVGGLAAALEARYRLARRQGGASEGRAPDGQPAPEGRPAPDADHRD